MANTDKLKDLLRDEAPLPSSLSWEEMQTSIIHGLTDDHTKKPPYYLRTSLLLLVLLLIGATAIWLSQEDDNTTSSSPHLSDLAISKPAPKNRSSDLTLAPTNESKVATSVTVDNETSKPTVLPLTAAPHSSTSQIKITRKIQQNKTNTISNNGILQPSTPVSYEDSDNVLATNDTRADGSLASSMKQRVPAAVDNLEEVALATAEMPTSPEAARPAVAAVQLVHELTPIVVWPSDLTNNSQYLPLDIVPIATSLAKNKISVSLGSSLWSRNTDLNNYERTLASTTATLQYQRQLSRRISLSAGLRYRALNSRLDYYAQRDTIVEVQQYYVNTLTDQRDTSSIMAAAYQFREINHLNQTTLVSIPIMIHYHGDISSSLSWQAGVGMEYTLLSEQEGRHLAMGVSDDGFRQAQPLADGTYDQITSSIGIQVSAGLDYALYDNLSATLQLGVSHMTDSWSSSATSQPTIADISLGVWYQW